MINRSAIIVRARRPFLAWLKGLSDPVGPDTTLADVNYEPNIYLLPEYEMDAQQDELLSDFYDIIFEIELDGWWTAEEDWPSKRTFKMFKEWFNVEFHSVVEDLFDAPLIDLD